MDAKTVCPQCMHALEAHFGMQGCTQSRAIWEKPYGRQFYKVSYGETCKCDLTAEEVHYNLNHGTP